MSPDDHLYMRKGSAIVDGTLVGVLVGGLLGLMGALGSQMLANKSRKDAVQHEAVRELAAQVLSTARHTWERKNESLMTQTKTIVESQDKEILKNQDNTAFFGDYDRWAASHEDLQQDLAELSFLVRDIDAESQQLVESLRPYWDQDIIGKFHLFISNNGEESYLEATQAFKDRIRRFLRV